jgi:hypothetical protein
MFLVPVSWESFEFSNIFLLNVPFTIPYVVLGLLGLFIGLVLNSKNGASFKSAYFLGSIFFPFNLFYATLFFGFFLEIPPIEEYTFYVFLVISLIQIGLYIYYGFFFKDPLDWTSHKVEPMSVDVKFIFQFVVAGLALLFLILNVVFYATDVVFSTDFLIVPFGFPRTTLYILLAVPWLLFALLMNQRLLLGIKDRLYFFVASSIAFYYILLFENSFSILIFFENFYVFDNFYDALFLIFTVVTYLLFPLIVTIFSLVFYKMNSERLVPYINRGYIDKKPPVNLVESMEDASYTSADQKIESWDVPSDMDWNDAAVSTSVKTGYSMQFDRNRVLMIVVHLALFLLFIIALNSKVYTLSTDGFTSRFSFFELRDLIQILDAFKESNEGSILIGIYLFIIIVVQLASAFGHLIFKPKFNNPSFLVIVVAQLIHFIVLIAVAIRFLFTVSDINDIFSIFGVRIDFGIDLGFLFHLLFLGLGIFTYAAGNRFLPQISSSLNSLDFGSLGSVSNNTKTSQRNSRPSRPPRPPRPPRPEIENSNTEEQRRPERPPRPPRPQRPEPRSKSTPVVNASESSELEKNLASLKRLLSEGLITEEEYKEKKKQQLDKL